MISVLGAEKSSLIDIESLLPVASRSVRVADAAPDIRPGTLLGIGVPRTDSEAKEMNPSGDPRMNRREFMVKGSAAGLLAQLQAARDAHGAGPLSLAEFGAACGMKIGCASNKSALQNAPALAGFIKQNCNLLTPEEELKWGALRPAQGEFQFAGADFMLSFAQQNGMALRGHNLCWNAGNPPWLAQVLTRSNAESVLVDHIQRVAGRYAGKLDSWDVVNEPIAVWYNKPGGLYPGPWLDMLGPQYIDIAFHACAAADAKTLRVLNVHHVEEARDQPTRDACLTLFEALLKRNVPVQAIGIESHLDASLPLDKGALERFLSAIRGMGLKILITEMDVNDSKVEGDVLTRDRLVADCYREYLDIVLPAADPRRLVFWSISDHGWMDYMRAPQWQRSDGSYTHRPGLVGADMQLKPSYAAVASSLQQHCKRR